MDELLEYTEKTPFETGPVGPVTAPIVLEPIDIEPLTTARAADGTRTKVHAAPPPIPVRVRGGNTLPPPIATDAADDDIPMTVEPVVTRRAGTIPPPIPSYAKRPPTVPPIDAPSVVLAPSVDAEPIVAGVPVAAAPAPVSTELTPESWSIPPSDSAEMMPIVEPIPAPLAVRPSSVAPAAPLLGIAPPTSTLLGVTITPPAPVMAAPPVVAPEPVPVAPEPAPIASATSESTSTEVSSSTTLPPLPSPSPSWMSPPEWPARTSSQLIRPRAITSRPVPRPSEPPPLAPLEIDDEEITPTLYFERTDGAKPWNMRLVAGIGIGAVVVVSIIALAVRGGDSTSTPRTAAPARSHALAATDGDTPSAAPSVKAHAATTTAPPTTSAPPVTTTRAVATTPTTAGTTTAKAAPMVEIPISSWPAGATVTLVDDGAAKIIGHTPMTASVDASRSYDIVLAVSGRPTTVRHLDPNTTRELSVDLDPDPAALTKHTATKQVATAEPVVKKPATARPATPTPAPTAKVTPTTKQVATAKVTPSTPTPKAPTTTKQQVATAAPKPTNTARAIDSAAIASAPESSGTLIVSSKPLCEILVDGKATGLFTPSTVPLAAGAHAITLVNTHDKIKKTIAVHIAAKRATKLVQDFTAQ